MCAVSLAAVCAGAAPPSPLVVLLALSPLAARARLRTDHASVVARPHPHGAAVADGAHVFHQADGGARRRGAGRRGAPRARPRAGVARDLSRARRAGHRDRDRRAIDAHRTRRRSETGSRDVVCRRICAAQSRIRDAGIGRARADRLLLRGDPGLPVEFPRHLPHRDVAFRDRCRGSRAHRRQHRRHRRPHHLGRHRRPLGAAAGTAGMHRRRGGAVRLR